MTDYTGTGDHQGIVASILAEHDAHHGGTSVGNESKSWAESAPAPRCHATHAAMIGAPSGQIENTLQRIINNAHLATPEQSQWAKWWLERNRTSALTPPQTTLST